MDYPQFFTAFQEARGLIPGEEITGFECHNLGNLVVTSGKLLACDPYYCPDTHPFGTETIAPGHYPVFVSIARFEGIHRRVALAALLFRDSLPVNWAIAIPEGVKVSEKRCYTYCVDSGIGCFMDEAAVRPFTPICEDYDDETDPILKAMGENSDQFSFPWANVCVDQDTGVNIIAFESGWGDGGYPSYFGYDEHERVVCLITEFGVFDEKE